MTCFLWGDQNWPCAGRFWLVSSVMMGWLGFCVGGGGRNWLGFWMRAANRLVLVWASKLTCFLSGWSILTWFRCRGLNLTFFQLRGCNLFRLRLGVENDSFFSIWIEKENDERKKREEKKEKEKENGKGARAVLCWILRSQQDRESWHVDVLVMLYKTTHSWLSSSVVYPL